MASGTLSWPKSQARVRKRAPGPAPLRARANIRREPTVATVAQGWPCRRLKRDGGPVLATEALGDGAWSERFLPPADRPGFPGAASLSHPRTGARFSLDMRLSL